MGFAAQLMRCECESAESTRRVLRATVKIESAGDGVVEDAIAKLLWESEETCGSDRGVRIVMGQPLCLFTYLVPAADVWTGSELISMFEAGGSVGS